MRRSTFSSKLFSLQTFIKDLQNLNKCGNQNIFAHILGTFSTELISNTLSKSKHISSFSIHNLTRPLS